MLRRILNPRRKLALAVAMGALSVAPFARASTVVPMTLETMADHAGQVIMGTVVSVRSYLADGSRQIETEITLTEVEYLKGAPAYPADDFTLVVPGGTVGKARLHLLCTPTFEVSERWILFLLPTYKTFPIVGLSQGAIRVEPASDGGERVMSASSKPLVGIDKKGFAAFAEGPTEDSGIMHKLVGATNARVREVVSPAANRKGMTLGDFRTLLQPILDKSRDRGLTGPAGRRVPVQDTPVPMRTSTASPSAAEAQASAVENSRAYGVSRRLQVAARGTRADQGRKHTGDGVDHPTTPGMGRRGAPGWGARGN